MSWTKGLAGVAVVCAACNTGDELSPSPPAAPGVPPESEDAGSPSLDANTAIDDGSMGDAATDTDGASTETDQCPGAATEGHWADLYRCYFGGTGIANCGQSDGCHQTSAGIGSGSSGFICGQTADSCWQGMTSSTPPAEFNPIAPTDGGPSDVTMATLWSVLRKTSGQGLDDMPYAPTTVVFTTPDMARIAAWIQRGAPND